MSRPSAKPKLQKFVVVGRVIVYPSTTVMARSAEEAKEKVRQTNWLAWRGEREVGDAEFASVYPLEPPILVTGR